MHPAKEASTVAPARRWRGLLIGLIVGYSVVHLGYSLWRYNIFSGVQSGDFNRLFAEADEWRRTGSLPLSSVLYPPLCYALFAPLTIFDRTHLAHALYFVQLPLYVIAIAFLVRAVSPRRRPSPWEYLIAAGLLVNFQPFLETLAMHKIEGWEFVLIAWSIHAFRQRRDVVTGVLVFVAANLKYLPGMLGLYFLLKRETRVVRGLLAALAVYLLAVTAAVGPGRLWAYTIRYPAALLFEHRHEGTRPEASIEFQTLTGTINRWFGGRPAMLEHLRTQGYPPVPHAALALTIAGVLKLLLLAGFVWLIRRRWPPAERERRWPLYLLEISLALLMIFVVAPASRVHYAILLAPAFIIVGLLLYHERHRLGWTERLLFGVSYALTAMLIPGGLLNRLPAHPLWGQKHSYVYLWFSLPFYGYVLLGVCVVLCYVRLRNDNGRIA